MSFPLETVLSLGSKLVDLIGRFIPDRAKAQELTAEVQKAVAAAMQAEMGSQWLVGQWRAMAMLGLTGGILWKYVAGTLDFLTNPVDTTMGLIWLIGFSGYAITGETVKIMMAILKPNKDEKK
jgi:hypothetical protein